MESLHVVLPEAQLRQQTLAAAAELQAGAAQFHAWEADRLVALREKSGSDDLGSASLLWLRRSDEGFIRLVARASGRKPSSAASAELAAFRRQANDELGRLLTEQLALEKRLGVLVEDAYGLTPEERQLLRDTRPIRDPIDVLEDRLAGLGEENHGD